MPVYTDVLLLALLLPLQIANTLDSQARDDNLDDNLNVARRIREGTTNSDRLFVGKASFRLGLAQHTSRKNFSMAGNHCSLVVYRLSGAGKANFEPPNTTIGSPSSPL